MKKSPRIPVALALSLAALSLPVAADPGAAAAAGSAFGAAPVAVLTAGIPKAISSQTLGSRSTVTPSATLFGGFEIRAGGDVYIAVRGNSLGTLGITQSFLDAPRVRLFNAAGADLINDASGNPGFNACVAGSTFGGPVVTFYQNVRNQPVHLRDACLAVNVPAGVYTFTVTPSTGTSGVTSVPSSGQVLFEVTLEP